jgi:hypothetical protein
MLRSIGRITGHGVENLCRKVIADFLFSDDTGFPYCVAAPGLVAGGISVGERQDRCCGRMSDR